MAARRRKEPIDVDHPEGWPALQKSLDELIYTCENDLQAAGDIRTSMKNYTIVYGLCVQRPPMNFCAELYRRYEAFFVNYLNDTVLPALRAQGGELMIGEIGRRWQNHKDIMVKFTKKFFFYLDQYYTTREQLPKVYDTAMLAFKNTMFPFVRAEATTAILDLVSRERGGDTVDRNLLKGVVDLFVEMGLGSLDIYRDGFEVGFLQDSLNFYARMASENVGKLSLPEFLQLCDEKLTTETTRVANYLHPETEPKLVAAVKKEMLEVHLESLMTKPDSGLIVLFGSSLSAFDTANKEMVALLYKLYKDLTEPKARIAAMLLEHIKKLGVDEVEEFAKNEKAGTTRPDDGAKFIQNLVDIHRHFVMMFDECCDGETTFHQQLKDAYVKFIINNDELGDPHFIPSNLAIFCDTFLERKSAKKNAGVEVAEQSLRSAVQMYSYMHDKDYFNHHYKRTLASRLLHNTTVGHDQENQFLTMIKQKCGIGSTADQEAMIQDIRESTTKHERKFQEFRDQDKDKICQHFADVTVTVRLLTATRWPLYKTPKLNVTGELGFIKRAFESYFKSIDTVREPQLSWLFTQGGAVIRPHSLHSDGYAGSKKSKWGGEKAFGNKAFKKFKILLANPCQLAILMLFNEQEKWTTNQLEANLGIDLETLKPYLMSLYKGREPVLHVRPIDKTKDMTWDNQIFECNSKLAGLCVDKKTNRIKPKIEVKMGSSSGDFAEEKGAIDRELLKERKHAMEALAVRAMKANRTMNKQDLIVNVMTMIAKYVRADAKFTRGIVEDLIERKFLRNDDDDPRILHYIA